MTIQSPIVLASGFFSQLFPGDTVPGTDTTAQASGNAALVLAKTALASGNAGISIGLTALASGNAGISTGLTAQASGNAGISTGLTALASGNAGISTGLTALASGNAALSLADLKLPLSGGVLTGDVILDNQVDARFREATASGVNYVGFQAPANIVSDITFTLPSVDGTNGQVLKTDGSGALGWADNTTFATTAEVGGTHTTGSVTSGANSLTVASATGIVAGMFIVGEGIAPGTTVSTIVSTTVTMSANAAATLSSAPVAFYIANKSLSPGLVAGQLCLAWVNFDGTGTVAIGASFNVSSITDNGTGDYTVNFTTAMVDANYATICTVPPPGTLAQSLSSGEENSTNRTKSASSVPVSSRFVNSNTPAQAFDAASFSVAIFR